MQDTHAKIEYWVLRELGTPKAFAFMDKHIALESLERTYPKAVEDQAYLVEWRQGHHSAIIRINGAALYNLGIYTVDVRRIASALPPHPDTRASEREKIDGQVKQLISWWGKLNEDTPLESKDKIELQNLLSSTELLLKDMNKGNTR